MARLGTAVRRWTKTHARGGGGSVRTDIALNRDGRLLRKRSWLGGDGRLDYTDGWKLTARRITDYHLPAIHKNLTAKGYVEVEV